MRQQIRVVGGPEKARHLLDDLAPAVAGRQPHYGTHAIEGLEAIPATFPRMFTGRGAGKMIAKTG